MIMAARLTIEELRVIAAQTVRQRLAPWLQRLGYYDDCLQEVWMQLVKAQGRFDNSRGITENYYMRLRAKGAVIDFTDHMSFRRRHGGAQGSSKAACQRVRWPWGLPPPWHNVFARDESRQQTGVENDEFKARFFAAFGSKRQHYARCVWECAVVGRTMKEAGRDIGISEPRVCSLFKMLHHGNQQWARKVRAMLQKEAA